MLACVCVCARVREWALCMHRRGEGLWEKGRGLHCHDAVPFDIWPSKGQERANGNRDMGHTSSSGKILFRGQRDSSPRKLNGNPRQQVLSNAPPPLFLPILDASVDLAANVGPHSAALQCHSPILTLRFLCRQAR